MQILLKSHLLGLIFIPNPFTATAQRQLIHNCLQKYTQAPNSSNLDAHYDVPAEGIWNLYTRSHNRSSYEDDCELLIKRKSGSTNGQKTSESADPYDASASSNQLNLEMDTKNVGEKLNQTSSQNTASDFLQPSELVRKLRWVSLGYQYNWSEKVYFFDRLIPVPDEAGKLSIAIAKAVEGIGYQENGSFLWQNNYRGEDYVPEAGIVNYYQLKDTLMAHVDRSEINMDAPLVSIR
jgi:alkylated DNA repair protein alkB family protein 1